MKDMTDQTPDEISVWRLAWIFVAQGCLLGLIIWGIQRPGLSGPFVFDDISSIVLNPTLDTNSGLLAAFSPSQAATTGGRPLLNASLAFNHRIWGAAPESFRILNMLIHSVNGMLVAIAAFLVLGALGLANPRRMLFVALATSFIWAIHPLQVTSVVYVVQRAESMASMFYLLAFVFGMAYLRRGGAALLALAAASLLASGLTKEIAVTAPLAITLVHGVGQQIPGRNPFGRPWAGLMAAMALALIPVIVLTLMDSRRGTAGFGYDQVSEWDYFRTEHQVIWHYVRSIFWPQPLAFDYGWPEAGNGASDHLYSLLYIVTIIVLLIGVLRRAGWAVGGAGFLLALLPTSSFIPINDFAFDHRCYLASVWLLLPAIVLAGRMIGLDSPRLEQPRRLFGGILFGLAAAALATGTYQRSATHADSLTLWAETARQRPANARAFNNLGVELVQANRRQEAFAAFSEAKRLNPRFAEAWNNLGLELLSAGQLETARDHFAEAARLNPDYHPAVNNLGSVLYQLGQPAEAAEAFKRACELQPESADYHEKLAIVLRAAGREAEASNAAETARQLREHPAQAQLR